MKLFLISLVFLILLLFCIFNKNISKFTINDIKLNCSEKGKELSDEMEKDSKVYTQLRSIYNKNYFKGKVKIMRKSNQPSRFEPILSNNNDWKMMRNLKKNS